jgi:phosphoesterase RecJ-like protein
MNPTNPQILNQILATLKEAKTFCLSGHQNPDGDVIGSELAMAGFLKRLDPSKKIDILNNGPVPKSLSYLPNVSNVKNVNKIDGFYDVVIVFECSGADRMGGIIDLNKQAKTVINIDHHLHNPNYGHINFVESHTSSTAELIFKILAHSGLPITKDEAVCMYSGMVTDTGWFRYSNTNTQTHAIASELVKAGVPVAELSEHLFMSRTSTSLRILAYCLTQMTLHYDNRVALLTLPEKVFQEFNGDQDDTEDIVNFGLQIGSVCSSIFIREKGPSLVKVSLRSKGQWDVNKVARTFDGGGHRNASGCKMEMDLATAKLKLLEEIKTIFS